MPTTPKPPTLTPGPIPLQITPSPEFTALFERLVKAAESIALNLQFQTDSIKFAQGKGKAP